MTASALPPDRLRAMARVLDPVAWKTVAEWRLETTSDHYAQLAFGVHAERRTKALAAAQACWEASPGGELMEALLGLANVTEDYTDDEVLQSFVSRAREALRQALPQGTET